MKNNKLKLLVIICVLALALAFAVGCNNEGENGGSGDVDPAKVAEFLTAWEGSSETNADYCTNKNVSIGVVSYDNGARDFFPTTVVKDKQGNAVAVIGNEFYVDSIDDYVVTYTIVFGEKTYHKTVTVHVQIPNPGVYFGGYSNYYVDLSCQLPSLVIIDANGDHIEPLSVALKDPSGSDVTVANNRFVPTAAGDYKMVVTSKGMNNVESTNEKVLTVAAIPENTDILLRDSLNDSTWYSSEGKSPVVQQYYAKQAYENPDGSETKTLVMDIDFGFSLETLKTEFDLVEFEVFYYGTGANVTKVSASDGGATYEISNGKSKYSGLTFWGPSTFNVPTQDFNGKLYFTTDGGGGNFFSVAMNKATAKPSREVRISGAEMEESYLFGTTVDLPVAEYYLRGEKVEDAEIVRTVKVDGEEINLAGNNVKLTAFGDYEITYECEGATASVSFGVGSSERIWDYTAEEICYSTTATLGAVAFPTYGDPKQFGPFTDSTYGRAIRFTEKTGTYTMTFDLGMTVDQVKAKYSAIEIEFALYDAGWGVNFDNGAFVTTGNAVRSYIIPTENWTGTISMTRKNAWDESEHVGYVIGIISVSGHVEGAFNDPDFDEIAIVGEEYELPEVAFEILGETVSNLKTTATFNGEAFDLTKFDGTFTKPGTLKIDYVFGIYKKSIEITVKNPVEIVLSDYVKGELIGYEVTLPTATAFDNKANATITGATIDMTATFNGNEIEIVGGKFKADNEGRLIVTYTYDNGTFVATKVISITFSTTATLYEYGDECCFTSTATIKTVDCPSYCTDFYGMRDNVVYFKSQNTTSYTITFNLGMTLQDLKDKYDYVTFNFGLYDDGWGIAFNGTEIHGNPGIKSVTVNVDDFDGTVTVRAWNAWDEGDHSSGYNIVFMSIIGGIYEE